MPISIAPRRSVLRPVAVALAAAGVLIAVAVGAAGCSTVSRGPADELEPKPGRLVEVAHSDGYQWTGVAASRSGRVFVNYPRWNEPMRWSVAEVSRDGRVTPYPNAGWQSWSPGVAQSLDRRWVCVQSVHVDDADRLWVLDSGSPQLAGVIPGGGAAKLVRFDLTTNSLMRVYKFDDAIAPKASYLNDVRVDTRTDTAYITDSGLGAIVVLDLKTGAARRVLDDHPSTKAEPGVTLRVEGRDLRFAADGPTNGQPPQIHADGLALSPDGELLYYQPITGRTLYRVPTDALRDPELPPAILAGNVQSLGTSVVTDGMAMDEHGNLYFTALEQDAVVVRRPDGRTETLVADPRLAWPDTIALAPDNTILVSTAQIHRTPWFQGNTAMPSEPYRIFALRRAGK